MGLRRLRERPFISSRYIDLFSSTGPLFSITQVRNDSPSPFRPLDLRASLCSSPTRLSSLLALALALVNVWPKGHIDLLS